MKFHSLQNSFCVMSYGVEYLFGQLKSAVLILSLPNSLDLSLRMALVLHNNAMKQL